MAPVYSSDYVSYHTPVYSSDYGCHCAPVPYSDYISGLHNNVCPSARGT